MKTITQILPGVKFIGWIDCSKLPGDVALSGICRIPVPILTDIHPIDFFDDPQCDCKTKKEGGGSEDSATLKFLTSDELPQGIPLGFIVTDVNGRSFLIGSKERPVPIPAPERRLGTPGGDAAGCFYEITHIALKSLIPCEIIN